MRPSLWVLFAILVIVTVIEGVERRRLTSKVKAEQESNDLMSQKISRLILENYEVIDANVALAHGRDIDARALRICSDDAAKAMARVRYLQSVNGPRSTGP